MGGGRRINYNATALIVGIRIPATLSLRFLGYEYAIYDIIVAEGMGATVWG